MLGTLFSLIAGQCDKCGRELPHSKSVCPNCGHRRRDDRDDQTSETGASSGGFLGWLLFWIFRLLFWIFLWLWRRQLYFPLLFIGILSTTIAKMTATGEILHPLLGFCVVVLLPSALWVLWKVYRTKRNMKRAAVECAHIWRQLSVSQRRDFDRAVEEPDFDSPAAVRKAIEDMRTVGYERYKPLPFYLSPFLSGRLDRYLQQQIAALRREAEADEGNESSTQPSTVH